MQKTSSGKRRNTSPRRRTAWPPDGTRPQPETPSTQGLTPRTPVTALTGATSKGKNHAAAAGELKQALGKRPDTAAAERALRELTSAKSDVEYGIALVTAAKAEPLVRRARTLVDLAVQIVRLGR
jgi:hypothetical protein